MELEPEAVASETNHEGRSYYFCSNECREKFDIDPARYTRETASTAHR
jgi:Cu+-exporting ATPase